MGKNTLAESLWGLYDYARRTVQNYQDLGTYNPASRLPSGAPSDHAVNPAYAFDVGGTPDSLQNFFNQMVGNPAVNYVIYKDKIWSRSEGLHPYTHGGHETHVHVSGIGSPNATSRAPSNVGSTTGMGGSGLGADSGDSGTSGSSLGCLGTTLAIVGAAVVMPVAAIFLHWG